MPRQSLPWLSCPVLLPCRTLLVSLSDSPGVFQLWRYYELRGFQVEATSLL